MSGDKIGFNPLPKASNLTENHGKVDDEHKKALHFDIGSYLNGGNNNTPNIVNPGNSVWCASTRA